MNNFDYLILTRTLHVIGVVTWIGGVAFVTTVLIPSLKKITDTNNRLELFEQLEGKFSLQARIATLVTGISGYYMLDFLNAWDRYQHLQFWWMHLMTFIWAIFTIVLFVLEPLFLHRWFREQAAKDSDNAFAWLHRMHNILLTLSIIAVAGAVAGSHGYQF
ncbi:MAG: hypothetical protein DRR06_08415 [Gammaproteobacteria bacterium]|nr:MAG: hypothetical protein DRR06_08415 [Gammaproteobacteria bacterium]RLA53204.1 MAG: hypothetical protein DRR42_05480 [Gammaproteobacteria bacterium]